MNAKRFASRMKKELEVFVTNPPTGISCCPKQTDSLTLEAVIIGPVGTPYHDGIFHLDIMIPDEYPFFPPRVRFLTPIYHPNIDEHGRICLDILKVPPSGSWRCTCSIENVLLAIQCLLSDPNPDDPLIADIADIYINDRELYNKFASEYTKKHAIYPNPPVLPQEVTTPPLLKSKLTSESLDNIPAVFQQEDSSTLVVTNLQQIDSEPGFSLREDPLPPKVSAGSSTSKGLTYASISRSASPKLSIMEPDANENRQIVPSTGKVYGTSSLESVSSALMEILKPWPAFELQEPDLMDSEQDVYFDYMPGPSSRNLSPRPSTSTDDEPSTSTGTFYGESSKKRSYSLSTESDVDFEENKKLKTAIPDLIEGSNKFNGSEQKDLSSTMAAVSVTDMLSVDPMNNNNNNNNFETDGMSASNEQPQSGVKRGHSGPVGKKDLLSKRKKSS